MSLAVLIFPHQLFASHPALDQTTVRSNSRVVLVEDSLYFGDHQYPLRFHKQKLAYHRATINHYASALSEQGFDVCIEPYRHPQSNLAPLCQRLAEAGVSEIHVAELNDFALARRLQHAAQVAGVQLVVKDSPGFINSTLENQAWRQSRKRWFMADFYQWQRRRLDILMDGQNPEGGRWSLDDENRKKMPKQEIAQLPVLPAVRQTAVMKAAVESVNTEFPGNPGTLEKIYYPVSADGAERWLKQFLGDRFEKFGPYEDAMVAGQNWLHHSVLTPMLNTGLLSPGYVVDRALDAARASGTPLNSVEGFVRQIIGWREFMRATYHDLSVPMRTTNHWGHTRKMPAVFYHGNSGIDPVDDVILRILDTGYCHHIERLMVLGGFMFLCEIDPDEIYTWFMEMFIDSYDWVMVPNVYAMSQHADGGTITTKPYFSGSNYILKMSNHRRGEWSVIWDGLFWRWVIKNQDRLKGNPRWAMMVKNAENMDEERKLNHLTVAQQYLDALS